MRGILITLGTLAIAAAGFAAIGIRKAEARGQTNAAVRHAFPAPDKRVDINRASMADLVKIPGMTPSWAGRIVRFRPYHAKSDLLERGVLPSDVYDRIRNYVIAHRVKKRD